jgi:hypothetical protein
MTLRRIIAAGHHNKTARTMAVRDGETINAPAFTTMVKQIIANNRARRLAEAEGRRLTQRWVSLRHLNARPRNHRVSGQPSAPALLLLGCAIRRRGSANPPPQSRLSVAVSQRSDSTHVRKFLTTLW